METTPKKTKKVRKKAQDLPPIMVLDNRDLSGDQGKSKLQISDAINPIKVVGNNEISGKGATNDLDLRKKDRAILTQKPDASFTIMRVEALWGGESVEKLDPKEKPLWDLDLLKIPTIWSYYAVRGSGVKVTVIDSGINTLHPAFAGKHITAKSFLKGVDDPADQTGHGTWVAGKILGNGVGIAPQAELCALRVLDDNGTGSSAFTNRALAYSFADDTTDIVNLSLGSPIKCVEQERLIWKLYRKGVLIVAAAGNRGASVMYPGAFDGVITVGAICNKGARASFSNYGASLEVVAPGVSCYGPHLGCTYRRLEGTSMAAPIVSGVMALALSYLKASRPKLTKIERRDILIDALQASARDLGPKGWDQEFGFGSINPLGLFETLTRK